VFIRIKKKKAKSSEQNSRKLKPYKNDITLFSKAKDTTINMVTSCLRFDTTHAYFCTIES